MNQNLTYMLSKVQAVSTQTFKLQPQNSTSASAGTQVRIALPSNTLLNLKSLKLFFTAKTTGDGFCRLPSKIDSLIDRVELQAGGVTIDGGELQEYGLLSHARQSLLGDTSGSLGHTDMVLAKSYHNGATLTENEIYPDDSFCVSQWNGFISSCSPSIIDTGLLPDLTLVITMASDNVLSNMKGLDTADYILNEVLSGTATAKRGKYVIENIRMTAECLGLGTGVYDQLVTRAIEERGSIELPFTQYNSTLDTHNGSTRFNVSCQSLDRIWTVFRKPTYASGGPPVLVPAGIYSGGIVSTSTKYTPQYFECSVDEAATCQFQLNGSMTPGFQANISEWMEISKNAVDFDYNACEMKTLNQYRTHYAVLCHRLCLPGGGGREISGLDTRGINLSGSLNTVGVASNTNVVIFCEMKSVLQIGANKQFSVVK